MLAAAGVAAWSLIALMVPSRERERIVRFLHRRGGGRSRVLLAAGAELLWQLPILTIGCGLIVAALLITIQAAQLSALWARFPLPVIPAPGDPTPSAPSLRVLEDLPRRVRISDAHQNGFIAAAVLLSVLGSVAIALRPEALSGLGWYVVAATAATATLRARVWDSAACKAWLLAQPYLVAGVLLVFYTATGRYVAALGAVLVLTALLFVWVVVALNPRHRLAGELFAAAAPAAGLCRRRAGRLADPGDGLPGRSVQLGAQSMIRAGLVCSRAAFGRFLRPLRGPVRRRRRSPAEGRPGRAAAERNPGARAADGAARRVQHLRSHPGHRCRACMTPSQSMLNLPAAWQFSRGDGQLVAVLDTGVRPGPRLPNVDPGGDYVETTDGLTDCDGHGTLVAGIVAGQPGDDGFSGVAPAARVVSHAGDLGQVLADDAGRRSAAGAGIVRRRDAGPGDRACGRPRCPGDQHLRR